MNENSLEIIPIRTKTVRNIPSDLCIFCGKPLHGQSSKEHVFPTWLLKELDIENEIVTPTHFKPTKPTKMLSQRRHTMNNLIEGRVCSICNNGWMSKLETSVQQTLIKLIRNRRSLTTMYTHEGPELARWAIKTASMLNSSANYSALIPEEHYKLTMAGKIPEGVSVYALQIPKAKTPCYWMQAPMWLAEGPKKLGLELASRSYKIAMRFDKLLLMVAYWPDNSWSQLRWFGVHFLLSATKGAAYQRSLKDFPLNDSSKAFGAFVGSLYIRKTSD